MFVAHGELGTFHFEAFICKSWPKSENGSGLVCFGSGLKPISVRLKNSGIIQIRFL